MEVDQRIVLPGDVIKVSSESTIVLGPGLRQEGDDVVATKAGLLHHLEVGNRYWIESNQKRVKSRIEFIFSKRLTGRIVYCSNWRVSYRHSYCKDERIFSRGYRYSTFSCVACIGFRRSDET